MDNALCVKNETPRPSMKQKEMARKVIYLSFRAIRNC